MCGKTLLGKILVFDNNADTSGNFQRSLVVDHDYNIPFRESLRRPGNLYVQKVDLQLKSN